MGLQVWSLTSLGKVMARSIKNPRSVAWAVIHHLDRVNAATPDQIATYTDSSPASVSAILTKLKGKGIVTEINRAEV